MKSILESNKQINVSDNIEKIWSEILQENSKKIENNKIQQYQIHSIKEIMQHYVQIQIQYVRECINEILQSNTVDNFTEKWSTYCKSLQDMGNKLIENDLNTVLNYSNEQYNFKKKEVMQHCTQLCNQYFENAINNVFQSKTWSNFLQQYGKFISDICKLKDNKLFKYSLDSMYNQFTNKRNDIIQYINALQKQVPTDDLKIEVLCVNNMQMLKNSGNTIIYKYQQPLIMKAMYEYISEVQNIDEMCTGYYNAIDYVLPLYSEIHYVIYYIDTENPWAIQYVYNYLKNKANNILLKNPNISQNTDNTDIIAQRIEKIDEEFCAISNQMHKHPIYMD